MEITVMGPGCPSCHQMEEPTKKAVRELGITDSVGKMADFAEIMKYTLSTPALVMNVRLKRAGKPLPGLEKTKELLRQDTA